MKFDMVVLDPPSFARSKSIHLAQRKIIKTY